MTQVPPNLAGVDFSQYQSWQVVRSPRGGVYYKVPGTSYVYDPFASAARRQTVLYLDPTPEIDERNRQQDLQDRQLGLAERQASPEGQLIPVFGGVAGTAGGIYVANQLMGDGGTAEAVQQLVNQNAAQQGAQVAQQAAPAVTTGGSMSNPGVVAQPQAPAAVTTPGDAFSSSAMAPQSSVAGRTDIPVVQDVKVVPPGGQVPDGYTAVGASAAGDGSQIAVPTDQIPQDGSLNFGQAAQGVLAGYQIYQGFKAFGDGDYLGGGLGLAGGGANLMASGLLGAGARTAAQGAVGGYLLPGLNVAAGLYTGYQTLDSIGDMAQGSERNQTGAVGGAASGAAIGTAILPGLGTAIGAGVGALVGWGASLAGSGKDKYQMIRDKGRDYLQQNGILDDKYQGTLADGTKFDFGKDGKKYGKPQFDNPVYGSAAAYGNVLASVEGMYGRGREAMAMLYGNAAVSNAEKDPNKVLANYRHFFTQRGITFDAAKQQLDQQLKDGKLTQGEYDVYVADLGKIVPPGGVAPKAPAAPQTPQGKGAGVIPGPPVMLPQPQGPIAQVGNLGINRGPGPAPQPPVMPPAPPPRSSTVSPGISLEGQRINYQDDRMGRALANRMNRSRR